MANDGPERSNHSYGKYQVKVAQQNGLSLDRNQGFIFPDGPWVVEISNPKSRRVLNPKIKLQGRFVLLEFNPEVSLRLKYGTNIKHVQYVTNVPKSKKLAVRHKKHLRTTYSFTTDFEFKNNANCIVEIKLGANAWRTLCQLDLFIDNELTVKDLKSKNLSIRMAEHTNLLNNKKAYFYESEIEPDIKLSETDPKLIAFYLPQFHPIKENDKWWGKGFTEWSNVASNQPKFIGHEQPRLPADLGYYDLRVESVMEQQINMARRHGIHGFCIYYYWFSGKKLLDHPVNTILKNRDWNFNYMICWANENWTRQWDGQDKDILISQEHSKDDPLNFIKDVEAILLDKRYIRHQGKPVLAVYRPSDLTNPKRYTETWRQYFKKKHNQDLYIVGVQSFNYDDPTPFGFDQALDFAPLSFFKYIKNLPTKKVSDKLLVSNFTGQVYDLRTITKTMAENYVGTTNLPGVLANWDNDARKKGKNSSVYHGGNPDLYGMWLDKALSNSGSSDKPNFVFINAWNEWAESACLEPDKFYGHALLNRTTQVLAKHSQDKTNQVKNPIYNIKKKSGTKLAVVAHIYHPEFWPILQDKLKRLGKVDYDLFVTLPSKNEDIVKEITSAKINCYTYIVPNRGRDVLPFVHLCRRLSEVGYQQVLKLHSKKTLHRDNGRQWQDELIDSLLPATDIGLQRILNTLEVANTGVIGPAKHHLALSSFYGGNKAVVEELLAKSLDLKVTDFKNLGFFGGTMFWARIDSLNPILKLYLQPEDFESESGQIDGTLAHALERVFCAAPTLQGKTNYLITKNSLVKASEDNLLHRYDYADPVDK